MRIDQERAEDERTTLSVTPLLALEVALAVAEHSHGRLGPGLVPCPVCGGQLHYVIGDATAAVRCSTPGCVSVLS